MSSSATVLPVVSMEDPELFPKSGNLDLGTPLPRLIDAENNRLITFCSDAHKLWWSRLVISIRGYVANCLQQHEEQLFSIDDAFIILHKVFVERSFQLSPVKFYEILCTLMQIDNLSGVLEQLDKFGASTAHPNPFANGPAAVAFAQVFGAPNSATYHIANIQKHAYITFMKLLNVLSERFSAEQTKKKGIRFDKDPEWQPDERVVLFEQFYKGNRTWVLRDFDRHILAFWRPKGTNVIFGDSYIEKKRRSGHLHCDYCGMLEQMPEQFPMYNKIRFCSEECFAALLDDKNPSGI